MMNLQEFLALPDTDFMSVLVDLDELSQLSKPGLLIEECIAVARSTFGWNLETIIKKIKCETLEELTEIVKGIVWKIAHDPFLNFKENQQQYPEIKSLVCIYQNIIKSNKLEKYTSSVAKNYWFAVEIPQRLENTLKKIRKTPKDDEIFAITTEKIQKIYNFTNFEMEGLRYFISHVLQKEHDPILNRSMYFFGEQQYTGKTTVAKIIAGILNGFDDWHSVAALYEEYKSDIPCELQFDRFVKPKATLYNCVLMDEAFKGSSTKKYYDAFKASLTGNKCDVEEKFGGIYSLPCRRNYIFTSNKPPANIIEDRSERRVSTVHFTKIPDRLKYSEIFDLWRTYIYNCTPAIADEAAYYERTYPDTQGREAIDLSDRISTLEGERLYAMLLQEQGFGRYQVSFPSFFFNFFKNEGFIRNDGCCEMDKRAVIQAFGEPKHSGYRKYYNISDLTTILMKNKEDEEE